MGSLAASLADELPGVTLADYHGGAFLPHLPIPVLLASVFHYRMLPILIVLIGSCVSAQELEDPNAPSTPEIVAEVERLVADLSGESYDAREAAGRRLLNIGEAAWDRVFEASQSASDLELRYRAGELLKTLEKKK